MQNRETARRLVGEVVDAYNRKDLQALGKLYDPGIELWSSLGESATGRQEVMGHIAELFQRLPDEHMTAETVVADAESVVVELTSRGTSATGQPYELQFTEVFEVSDGQISSIKTYIDPRQVEAVEG
jgi:ketosteroid isomerase-like protein